MGIPLTAIGFAGFLSKDAIIEVAYAGTNGGVAFWLLVVAALFTSFYSWRLMFLTFWGTPRGDHHTHDHAHESPAVMTIPLGVLAIGAIFSGMLGYNAFFYKHDQMNAFFGLPEHHVEASEGHGETAGEGEAGTEAPAAEGDQASAGDHAMAQGHAPQGAVFFAPDNTVIDDAHHAPTWVKLSPFIAMLIGLGTAYVFYIVNPSLPRRLAENQPQLYQFLLNKWYFDEIYDFLFVRPAKAGASCGNAGTAPPSTGRSTGSPWASCRGSRGSRAAGSPATSSPTPSRWCSASSCS